MLFVAIVMLIPLPDTTPALENRILDKIIHALLYGILAFFWSYGLFRQQDFVFLRTYALQVSAAITFFYSVVLEGLQTFMPHRSFDWWDIVANLVGIIFAYLTMRKLIALARHKPQKVVP